MKKIIFAGILFFVSAGCSAGVRDNARSATTQSGHQNFSAVASDAQPGNAVQTNIQSPSTQLPQQQNSYTRQTPADGTISVLSFGDIMFDRDVRKYVAAGGNPFAKITGVIAQTFSGENFISANLEGPITLTQACQKKALSFKFDPGIANLIRDNGINIVNMANNHSGDCFAQGFADTKKYLDAAGISHFGADDVSQSYTVETVGNKKIAFIGIIGLWNLKNIANYAAQIRVLKTQVEYVLVNIHWGTEYDLNFTALQQGIAHTLIDSGADVIIGHHPHVVEPAEVYKGRLIFYSLGNFVFDQYAPYTRDGLGVSIKFSAPAQTEFTLFPFHIQKLQPTALPDAQSKDFCSAYLKPIAGSVSITGDCNFIK